MFVVRDCVAAVERARLALKPLLNRLRNSFKAERHRRKPCYRLQVEGLEERQMLTTVAFFTSAQMLDCNAGSATVKVALSAASDQAVNVDYATSDISAHAGVDYTSAAGTLTIPAGSTSGTFTVPISGYTEPGNVTFAVTLSSPTHATLFSPTSDTITILEQPFVEFAAAAQSVDCNAASATVEVDLSASSLQTIIVHYATSDMSAHSAIDYTPATGNLTIPAGSTSGTFTVPMLGQDGTSNLTFAVTLIGRYA